MIENEEEECVRVRKKMEIGVEKTIGNRILKEEERKATQKGKIRAETEGSREDCMEKGDQK